MFLRVPLESGHHFVEFDLSDERGVFGFYLQLPDLRIDYIPLLGECIDLRPSSDQLLRILASDFNQLP